MTGQMECAVSDIEQKLVCGRPSEFSGPPCRGFGTGDDLSFQKLIASRKRKTQHIGRFVEVEELRVETPDAVIVDDRKADLRSRDRCRTECVPDDGAPAVIWRDQRLLVRDFYLNHR